MFYKIYTWGESLYLVSNVSILQKCLSDATVVYNKLFKLNHLYKIETSLAIYNFYGKWSYIFHVFISKLADSFFFVHRNFEIMKNFDSTKSNHISVLIFWCHHRFFLCFPSLFVCFHNIQNQWYHKIIILMKRWY